MPERYKATEALHALAESEGIWPYTYRLNLERTLLKLICLSCDSVERELSMPLSAKNIRKLMINERTSAPLDGISKAVLAKCSEIYDILENVSDRSHHSRESISRVQFHTKPKILELIRIIAPDNSSLETNSRASMGEKGSRMKPPSIA